MTAPGFPKIILALDAAVFLAVGACFLFAPQWLLPKVDLQTTSGTATADIRAVYGGLDAGIGLFLFLCLRKQWIAVGLWCAAIVFGGLTAGRSIGLVLDAPHTSTTYILLATEVAGLVLSAAALTRARV